MFDIFLHPSLILAWTFGIIYVLLVCIIADKKKWDIFMFFGLATYWYWFTIISFAFYVFDYSKLNPMQAALYFVLFLIFGIVYSLYKWNIFVTASLKDALDLCKDDNVLQSRLDNIKSYIPSATLNRTEIAGWIALWPFYVLDNLYNFVFYDFFTKIAKLTESLFNYITLRISDRIISSYKKKMKYTVHVVPRDK